uniref:Uncharacterized protein n=1 Tax=Brassica oleracea var. oleracea TaxID=109376 RepID=A0A0D3BKT2_BRAOL
MERVSPSSLNISLSRRKLDRWEEATGEAVDEVIFLSHGSKLKEEDDDFLAALCFDQRNGARARILVLLCWYESAARARIIVGDGMLSDESTSEALAVRRLLGHRLPTDAHKAKKDWYDIVEEISCDSLVLLVILTNDRLTVGCELQDGKSCIAFSYCETRYSSRR